MAPSWFAQYLKANPYGTLGPSPQRVAATKKKKPAPSRSIPGTFAPATAPYDPYAEAQSQVDQMIAAALSALDREKQMAYDAAQQEAQMEYARGQALAEGLKQLGIADAVQKAFGDAATMQASLAHGYSGQLKDQAIAQAAAQQRMLSGTGQEGAVRNQGENMGNVQYGLGGDIPATALSTMGANFGAQAALQPGFALQFGAMAEAARRAQWAEEELPEWTNRRMDILDKKAELLNDAFSKVETPKTAKPTKLTSRTLANGQVQWFNPLTGKPVGKPQGPVRQKSTSSSSSNLQARTLSNGQVQWFDPETGKPVGAPQGPPKAAAKKAASKGYNLQFKTVNGKSAWFDPRTGRRVTEWQNNPRSTRGSTSRRPDGLSPSKVQQLRRDAFLSARDGIKGWTDDDGNFHPPKKPKDVLRDLMDAAIPFDIAVRAVARYFPPARKWYKDNPKAQNASTASVTPASGAVVMPASFASTHQTDNLGWPAIDIMGKAGSPVASPVAGTIVRHGSAQGGQALYLRADDGTMYWLGHIDRMRRVGSRVKRGQTIAYISADHPRPHVHLAKQSGARS